MVPRLQPVLACWIRCLPLLGPKVIALPLTNANPPVPLHAIRYCSARPTNACPLCEVGCFPQPHNVRFQHARVGASTKQSTFLDLVARCLSTLILRISICFLRGPRPLHGQATPPTTEAWGSAFSCQVGAPVHQCREILYIPVYLLDTIISSSQRQASQVTKLQFIQYIPIIS